MNDHTILNSNKTPVDRLVDEAVRDYQMDLECGGTMKYTNSEKDQIRRQLHEKWPWGIGVNPEWP